MQNNSIPVLYYHSVANHQDKKVPWAFLTTDIKTFTLQMRYLKKRGYTTCKWDELNKHLKGEKKLPNKCIHIQFDDGFLDNWSVVFPLMKELKFKFSIVVTPEFISKSDPRPFLDKTTNENIEEWWGYLSEKELIIMEESGLVDIQAHGFTHTWYESSDRIIDIYDGTQVLPWLYWNNNIDQKPFWLTNDCLKKIPYGYPIFENEKSLSNLKVFKVSQKFITEAINLYDPKKSKNKNLEKLNNLREKYLNNNSLGNFETNDEMHARLKKELYRTREFLKNILNKDINYLVWPGGGNNKMVQALAYQYGYILVSKGKKLNRFNSKHKNISRVAAYHEFSEGWVNPYLNVMLIQLQILRAQGNKFIGLLIYILKKAINVKKNLL